MDQQHQHSQIYRPRIWILMGSLVFSGGSEVKVSACNAGDLGSIPGSGRSPGEGNGNPLQYSCLENPMDGGAWWATVHGVTKNRTRLSDFTLGDSDTQQKAEKLWSEIIPSWCEIIQWYSPQLCSIIRVMSPCQETQHSEHRTLVPNRQRKQGEVRRIKGTQFYDWRKEYIYKVLRLIFFSSKKYWENILYTMEGLVFIITDCLTRRTGNNMDHLSFRLRKLLFIINLTQVLQLSINHRKRDLERQNLTLSFQKRFQQRAKKESYV